MSEMLKGIQRGRWNIQLDNEQTIYYNRTPTCNLCSNQPRMVRIQSRIERFPIFIPVPNPGQSDKTGYAPHTKHLRCPLLVVISSFSISTHFNQRISKDFFFPLTIKPPHSSSCLRISVLCR